MHAFIGEKEGDDSIKRISLFAMQINLINNLLIFILAFYGCKKKEIVQPHNNSDDYSFSETASASLKVCAYLDYGVFDICKTNTINLLKELCDLILL